VFLDGESVGANLAHTPQGHKTWAKETIWNEC